MLLYEQIIENIKTKATTIFHEEHIPDNILRQEVRNHTADILMYTELLETQLPKERLDILSEIGTLQNNFTKLETSGNCSKQNICRLIIPFRDKYQLTDLEALQIARNEISFCKMAEILSKQET